MELIWKMLLIMLFFWVFRCVIEVESISVSGVEED